MAYQLMLEKNEVDTIGRALGKLTMEEAIGLFAKIKSQCAQQEQTSIASAALATPPIEPDPAIWQGTMQAEIDKNKPIVLS